METGDEDDVDEVVVVNRGGERRRNGSEGREIGKERKESIQKTWTHCDNQESRYELPFMQANCRSMIKKTEAIYDYFKNIGITFGIFTETWTNNETESEIKNRFDNFSIFCGIRDWGMNQLNVVQISHALERISWLYTHICSGSSTVGQHALGAVPATGMLTSQVRGKQYCGS